MWVVPCTRDQLVQLIENPYRWIDQLNQDNLVPFTVTLADDFVMRVSIVDRPPVTLPMLREDLTKRSHSLASAFSQAAATLHQNVQDAANIQDTEAGHTAIRSLRERSAQAAKDVHLDMLNFPSVLDSPHEYVVQGISGTNAIVIRPLKPQILHSDPEWDAYWTEWIEKSELKAARSTSFAMGFGHLELSKEKTVTRQERAKRIAAFLTLAPDPTVTRNDENGKPTALLNLLLRKNPVSLTEVDRDGVRHDVLASQNGSPFKGDLSDHQIAAISFSFIGRRGDFPVDNNDATIADDGACEDMSGTLVETFIVIDDVIVKSYMPKPG